MQVASLYARIGLNTDDLQRGLKQSRDQITDAGKNLNTIGKESTNASGGLGKLGKALQAVGGIAAAAKFAQTIYELGEIGAQAERSRATFENLAGGAAQASSMLDGLKDATMGTKSELDLMNQATTLMALGMGDTAEDLGNIMRSVEGLGSRFGGTMQTFQLMMSNDSLMRIDSFGIGIEEATTRIDEFKAAGMDAGEAFDTAILELMNEKFESLGGTLEDQVTTIDRNKAAWSDLKTELGIAFSDMTATVSSATGGFASWFADIMKYTNEAREEFGYFSGSIEGVAKMFGIERMAIEGVTTATQEANRAMDPELWGGGATAILDSAEAWGIYSDALASSEEARASQMAQAQATAEYQAALATNTMSSADAWNTYMGAIDASGDQMYNFIYAQQQMAEAAAETRSAFLDSAAGLSEMNDQMIINARLEALGEAGLSAEQLVAAQEALLRQFGELTAEEESTQKALENLDAAYASGGLTAEGYALAVETLVKNIRDLESKEIVIGVTWKVDPMPADVGSIGAPQPQGMAEGGQFWTNGPTPLLVGEGGESEFVSVIPKSDMMEGGYGMGSGWTGDIIIQGASNPEETARAVIQKLRDRGILRTGGLR